MASKAARKIATDRNVNACSASVKNKEAAANRVAVAVNKAASPVVVNGKVAVNKEAAVNNDKPGLWD
jgi:hypothetical protein